MKNTFEMKLAMHPLPLCLLAVLLLSGMALGEVSREGLVAYYNFENNLNDLSGEGNNGQSLSPEYTEGKFGQAHLSTSPNSDVVIKDSKSLRVQNMTILLWIKPDFSDVEDTTNIVLSKEMNWAAGGYHIDYQHFKTGIMDVTGINFKLMEGGMSAQGYYNTLAPITLEKGKWYFIAGTFDGTTRKLYINGKLWENKCHVDGPGGSEWDDKCATNIKIFHDSTPLHIGNSANPSDPKSYWRGAIDYVRIYNRALSAEEIKALYEQGQTTLTVKKEAFPYSIRQYQTTNVTIQIKNTGTSEIMDIEVTDSTNSNLELIGGDFPSPKKYNSLSHGESRDIRYILRSKESGTFILNPAAVSYFDNTGNIKVVKSEPVSLTVVPSSESAAEISSSSDIGSISAVLLHGEKTDVVLGEDILLKLSAVNLITKPPMSVQVMIYLPSGMSVTGSEFVKSGAGIYTTTYTLNPGDGKDIEVHIKSNQVGDFNVKGRIVYYFGEDKDKAEDHTLNLPIKVRKEPVQTAPLPGDDAGTTAKTPGFEGMIIMIVLLLVLFFKKNR
jgi:hypothetical protein